MHTIIHRLAELGVLWAALLALPANTYSNPTELPHRLIVKFGSICCGTDPNARQQLSGIISQYEQQIRTPIVSKKLWWGIEGEFTLCFTLSELSAPLQEALVSDVRARVRSKHVKIEENVVCRGGWT